MQKSRMSLKLITAFTQDISSSSVISPVDPSTFPDCYWGLGIVINKTSPHLCGTPREVGMHLGSTL